MKPEPSASNSEKAVRTFDGSAAIAETSGSAASTWTSRPRVGYAFIVSATLSRIVAFASASGASNSAGLMSHASRERAQRGQPAPAKRRAPPLARSAVLPRNFARASSASCRGDSSRWRSMPRHTSAPAVRWTRLHENGTAVGSENWRAYHASAGHCQRTRTFFETRCSVSSTVVSSADTSNVRDCAATIASVGSTRASYQWPSWSLSCGSLYPPYPGLRSSRWSTSVRRGAPPVSAAFAGSNSLNFVFAGSGSSRDQWSVSAWTYLTRRVTADGSAGSTTRHAFTTSSAFPSAGTTNSTQPDRHERPIVLSFAHVAPSFASMCTTPRDVSVSGARPRVHRAPAPAARSARRRRARRPSAAGTRRSRRARSSSPRG